MKTLFERLEELNDLFYCLTETNSRNEKEFIIKGMDDELREDFNYALEVLTGKHKLGYTYVEINEPTNEPKLFNSLQELVEYLQEPLLNHDLSVNNTLKYCRQVSFYNPYISQILNREWRLGIGPSLLPKGGMSPMLAKKLDGDLPWDREGYFITEKLDGNRCMAWYDGERWKFQSRNGKEMAVEFDMSNLPTDFVYDGEVLSPLQVELSNAVFEKVVYGSDVNAIDTSFNTTSGLINRKTKNKELIYNIFDIVDDASPYIVRRRILDRLSPDGDDVRILPLLFNCNTDAMLEHIYPILDEVVGLGAEGLMINCGSARYEHKRTSSLLKVKKVQTMDMIVTATYSGTGKYEGMVGGLSCIAEKDDKIILCNVGSGLSDEQRLKWISAEKIIGKIVEVEYFSLSQNKNLVGTTSYSLRFPRLKKVRDDKHSVSID